MNKRNDFTGVNNRVNARGVAFIKSRKSIDNVSGTVIEDSGVREEIDRALIRQFDLLPVARKIVKEELANGQQN